AIGGQSVRVRTAGGVATGNGCDHDRVPSEGDFWTAVAAERQHGRAVDFGWRGKCFSGIAGDGEIDGVAGSECQGDGGSLTRHLRLARGSIGRHGSDLCGQEDPKQEGHRVSSLFKREAPVTVATENGNYDITSRRSAWSSPRWP